MIIIKIIFILIVLYGFIAAKLNNQKEEKKTKKAYKDRNAKGQFVQKYKKPVNGYRYILVNDYIKGSYLLKVKNNY